MTRRKCKALKGFLNFSKISLSNLKFLSINKYILAIIFGSSQSVIESMSPFYTLLNIFSSSVADP
jgi:hypothetical protein